MTQYKFRGKRKDNGEWVYGSLVSTSPDEAFILIGVTAHVKRDDYECYMVEVVPETVGMWTGLKDKNRKEIFSGQSVRFVTSDAKDYNPEYDYEGHGSTPITAMFRWANDACGFRMNVSSRFKIRPEMLEVVADNHEVKPAVQDSVTHTMNTDPNLKAASEQEAAGQADVTTEQATDEQKEALESASQDAAVGADSEEGSVEG